MNAGPYWGNTAITPPGVNGGSTNYTFDARSSTVELGVARRRLARESLFVLFFTFAVGFNLGLIAAGSR